MSAGRHWTRGRSSPCSRWASGVIVIANDFTALNVALPAMEQDFDVDVGTIQWTVNAYVLVFGMGLVTGGRLADMLGRRLDLLHRHRDLRRLLARSARSRRAPRC